MPFIKYDTDGLFSKRQAANLLGVCHSLFWWKVKAGLYPSPEKKIGNRFYYTPNQIEQLKELNGGQNE